MSIFNIIKPIGELLKVKSVDIYDNIFKLHNRLTVVLLLSFSALVSAHEVFGKPMDCDVGSRAGDNLKKFLDSMCYINGTYVIKNFTGIIGVDSVAPGISVRIFPETYRSYQLYYQWVGIILLVEAIIFYIPGYLWKIWERGRLIAICKDLDSPLLPVTYKNQRHMILQYLLDDNTMEHGIYAIRYFLCELFNLLAVILNGWILNAIFSGFWLEYAPAVSALIHRNWYLWKVQSAVLFPKFAKCDYANFGSSGSLQAKDALCLLSLNVLNEKIFAFLWIWYIFLLVITILNLIYRCICLLSYKLRIKLLKSYAMPLTINQITKATNYGNIGEWFLLNQIARNVHPTVFHDILRELSIMKSKKVHSDIFE